MLLKHPKNESLLLLKGNILFKIDSFKKVMDLYGQRYPRDLSNIAMCEMKLKNYDSAIQNYLEASKINSEFKFVLGQAYEKNKEIKKALKYYNEYLDEEISYVKNKKSNAYYYYQNLKDSINKLHKY